ncbi:replication protein [Serratia fonticola]|uniref:replication protein n=1 Tax=Serratia fonticola TaxID=47917 RepID=UPI001AE36CEE|nr:replication protein [Serratia fonticola]MBP1035858.1 replication protein [Serratia fonticola]
MASLAENIVVPIRPDMRVVERRVVDTENGYTRIANELLEAVIGAGLTQNQLLITLAIIRKTYGYNKPADWVGNAQLSELTGLPETRCSTERNKLVKMNILAVTGRLVGINKEVTSWKTKVNRIGNDTFTETVNFTESVNITEAVKESFTDSVNHALQNLLNTKDNNTKDNKDIKNIGQPTQEDSPEKRSKATQRPASFTPSEKHSALALKLGVTLQSEFESFCDYHDAKGSTFKKWDAALNMWLRNAAKFAKPVGTVRSNSPAKAVPERFSAKDYGQTSEPTWAE